MTTRDCPASELAANFDFTDPRVRQDPPAVYAELRKGPPKWSDAYGGPWGEVDPPENSGWRKPAAPFFTAKAVGRLEDAVREVTRSRLAAVIETGRCDLAQDLPGTR